MDRELGPVYEYYCLRVIGRVYEDLAVDSNTGGLKMPHGAMVEGVAP
jgi:hypothetical protein